LPAQDLQAHVRRRAEGHLQDAGKDQEELIVPLVVSRAADVEAALGFS
jgi:hypothetical protein